MAVAFTAPVRHAGRRGITVDLAGTRVIVCDGATGGCATALFMARAGARVLLRDQVLLQVAGMLASPKSVGMLLQEPTAVLRGIAQ